jgi:hypothetical protein
MVGNFSGEANSSRAAPRTFSRISWRSRSRRRRVVISMSGLTLLCHVPTLGGGRRISQGFCVPRRNTLAGPYRTVAAAAAAAQLDYGWSFGDGATGTGVATTHAYADDSTCIVILEVSDGFGGIHSTMRQVTLYNVAPLVRAGADATIRPGAVYSFSGGFSDPGVLDAPWSWTIDRGGTTSGGIVNDRASPVNASCQFCTAGTHGVTFTVTDKDGGTGSDALVLTVLRRAIGIEIRPGHAQPERWRQWDGEGARALDRHVRRHGARPDDDPADGRHRHGREGGAAKHW